MKKLYRPLSGAKFSKDGNHRFKLWRTWDTEKPLCLWVMLNPSTADETYDDPTIRRVISFSREFGYGGFYVGNLYSYITSDSDVLINWVRFLSTTSWTSQNDKALREMRVEVGLRNVILAWGNKGSLILPRVREVIEIFPNARCLGLTKDNQPKHPLFLSGNTSLSLFPMGH